MKSTPSYRDVLIAGMAKQNHVEIMEKACRREFVRSLDAPRTRAVVEAEDTADVEYVAAEPAPGPQHQPNGNPHRTVQVMAQMYRGGVVGGPDGTVLPVVHN